MPIIDLSPDLIIYNAHVVTMNPAQPRAEAVAVRHHRIHAVGGSAELLALAGPHTRLVDGAGATLLPGLADAHIHFADWGRQLGALPLADTTSKAQMLARLAEHAASLPGGAWIVSRGWNESRWGEMNFPTAADLDAATGPDHPTLLYRSDMHSAVVNSAALRAAHITAATADPENGTIDRNAAGAPTGVLREMATFLVWQQVPPVTFAQRLGAMRGAIAAMHRMGVTAIHDQRYGGGMEGGEALRAFQALRRAGELRLRVSCNVSATDLDHVDALGVESGLGDDTLRLGHIKLFADGSLGSRTAWMLTPFDRVPGDDPAAPPNSGVVVTPPDAMAEIFRRAVAAGFPVSIHAIGDRANREVLDLFEELEAAGPRTEIPHRIEHVQMIDPEDVPRLARRNLTASVQPVHALDDMDTADMLLGPRAARAYPFADLLQNGTRLAFGSDAPVANPSPWLGLHAAVVRQRPERQGSPAWYGNQRIGLMDALRAYTSGPAQAAGWARTIGAIGLGRRADLVLLDRDLLALGDEAITAGALAQTEVRMTVFDGSIVWEA
jgi:predicted amidohydrolase YtcJ